MSRKGQKVKKGPVSIIKRGSISVPIYATNNRIYYRSAGNGPRTLKSQHPQFTIAYYEGSRRIKRKFSDLESAQRGAELAATKLSNGEMEILKLSGKDRADFVHAVQLLREWNDSLHLHTAVADYVAAVKRLPPNTSLKEVLDFYLRRHPVGLPAKTVREVVNELVDAKQKAGMSDIYISELQRRLGRFADSFNMRISAVSGKLIESFIQMPKEIRLGKRTKPGKIPSGRTQNNYRRLINTLFKFAMNRGYLPKDHDEIKSVEVAKNKSGEIEIFTPSELTKLFYACLETSAERGNRCDREQMIPYLAIAAFCGLRSAEITRLDWAEIHLSGKEHFIEVKASKAKTGSRRTVPIPPNCAKWLRQFAQVSGPVCSFDRPDRQCSEYIAPIAKIAWKHNALRHSFISYRLAKIKNVHQISLEAGNSPQMVFKHYHQLVRETQADEWFNIVPSSRAKNIIVLRKVAA